MKKIILHKEVIKTINQKQLFQIKLPDDAQKLTGILITVNEPLFDPKQSPKLYQKGVIDLRMSSNQEVIFSDRVDVQDHLIADLNKIQSPGMLTTKAWWFSGTKYDFFKLSIPIKNRLIEAFYVDESTKRRFVDYELKIYLELKIKCHD